MPVSYTHLDVYKRQAIYRRKQVRGRTCFLYVSGLIFNGSFSAVDFLEEINIYLSCPVIVIDTVLLLLHIGELGITETEHPRIIQKGIRKPLISCHIFFFGLRAVTVSPGLVIRAVRSPFDSAVDVYKRQGI